MKGKRKGYTPHGGWGVNYLSVKKLLQFIPNDGCLLVFNADHNNWRVKVSETGMLRCHVADTRMYQRIRDIYITWREDD